MCSGYDDIAGRSPAIGRQTSAGLGKQAIFELNASISRKRQEIRPKLILVANRKVHMHFRLPPRSMTLDDLELLFLTFGEFRGIWQMAAAVYDNIASFSCFDKKKQV